MSLYESINGLVNEPIKVNQVQTLINEIEENLSEIVVVELTKVVSLISENEGIKAGTIVVQLGKGLSTFLK